MAAALSVAFTPTPLAAGDKLVIEATAMVSKGINFQPRSAYKKIFVGAAATASPANILSAYTAIYGILITSTKIFLRARVVDSTGQAGDWQNTNIIVT